MDSSTVIVDKDDRYDYLDALNDDRKYLYTKPQLLNFVFESPNIMTITFKEYFP
jgi:hypothetical protein